MDLICIHGTIKGLVQGVGFRYHTQLVATELGLQGWVKNIENGCVEVFACGERSQVDEFIDWLKVGPPRAKVDNLSINIKECILPKNDFKIIK